MRSKPSAPPRLAERFLELLVGRGDLGQSIIGDAREEYATRGATSKLGARIWYWGYVVLFALSYVGRRPRRGGVGGRQRILRPKHAIRALRRRPGFALAVTLTVGFGIGASTLALALVQGVLLRPLPYPEPERLVDVSRVDPEWFGGPPDAVQAANVFATPAATFFDWRERARSFEAIGAYATTSRVFDGDGSPLRVNGARTTAGVFRALSVPAHLGRVRVASDDMVGAPDVIVLGYDLWVSRFGGNEAVVGRTISLDGQPHDVIGVMPPGFAFPNESVDFWMGIGEDQLVADTRNAGWLHAVGRLRDGVALASVRDEMDAITRQLGDEHPVEGRFLVTVHPSSEVLVASSRRGLVLLLGSAVLVLLVGCANISGLFMARVTERRRELVVHAALGAGNRALTGLVVGEALVLAVAGGILGIALAYVGIGEFIRIFPEAVPRATEVGVDPQILGACLTLTAAVAGLLGVAPVLRSRGMNLSDALRDGGLGSTSGRGGARAQGLLILAEVAMAVVLLATTGLFLQSHLRTSERDRGFEPDDVLITRITLPASYRRSPESMGAAFEDLQGQLSELPGVAIVAGADQMPYSGGYSSPPATLAGEENVALHTSAVTATYFEVLSIPVLAGRPLTAEDSSGARLVTVISQALADQYWPDGSALGRMIRLDAGSASRRYEVVGVAGSVRYRFASAQALEYYRPLDQDPGPFRAIVIKVAPGQASAVAGRAERVLRQALPSVPIAVRPMTSIMEEDTQYRASRTGTSVLAFLAAVATALAILGVYSVLGYAVLQRRREIGIRTALGGGARDVLGSVLRSALTMTAAGTFLGLGASVWVASVLRSSLTEISTLNPNVLVGVVAAMTLTTLLASAVPAMRAMRVDPLVAFKAE
jgi:putative ABC transport system permease protein